MRLVVTGANRGIGLEFVRQFLERGDLVHAAVRSPQRAGKLKGLGTDRLAIHQCDVSDPASITTFGKEMTAPIDLLINNAGITGDRRGFEDFDPDDLLEVFRTNALGAMLVTRTLLPNLKKGKERKIVSITSQMGSMPDGSSGGYISYRVSKAALNMATAVMAGDLAAAKITAIVIHPGWVQTDMGGRGATLSANESVRGMIRVIDGISHRDTGRLFDYRGREIPW